MVAKKKFLLLVIPWCLTARQHLPEKKPAIQMIVFVHGTSGAVSNASLGNLYRIMVDNVENSYYEKAVDLIRSNPYMYKNQAMQEYGLKPIQLHERKPGQAAALFAYTYDTILRETFPEQNNNLYYTYGWSGVLSESIRYKNAADFYKELLEEYKIQVEKNPDKEVKICIIGYSHGGTVALQLARAYEREQFLEPLSIDLLILLGTPIQKETDHLVISSIFKKVYHIYSRGDKIQKMDFFSFERFFSYRRFNDDKRFITPEKVVQIELKIKPARREYKPHEKKTYVNRAPGHIELWFFGWTGGTYRQDFPLYPLPTACLIPSIIKAAQDGMPHETDLVIEVYPCAEKCMVKKRRYFKKTETKGISYSTLKKLQDIAQQETPLDFNRKDYLSHMNTAVNQAYGTISYKHATKGCRCYDFSCLEKEKRA